MYIYIYIDYPSILRPAEMISEEFLLLYRCTREHNHICKYKQLLAAAVGLTDRYLRPIPC